MKPTELLSREHRHIEGALEVLEVLAAQASRGELDVPCARDCLHFLRRYADEAHHGKEEDLLFPYLERKGFSIDAGPTAVMRAEHDEGRSHVRQMARMLGEGTMSSSDRMAAFSRHAEAFVLLLRQHITKEDTCLWSMANAVLSEDDERRLLEAFETFESDTFPDGELVELEDTVTGLRERVGLLRAAHA